MPCIKLKVYGQTVLLDGGGPWPEWGGGMAGLPPWICQWSPDEPASSGGARILEQVGPAAGPKEVW